MTKGATTVHLMSAGDVMYEMSEQMIIIMMDPWRAESSRLITDKPDTIDAGLTSWSQTSNSALC